MKIDYSLWNNRERMRARIKDLGNIILSITAVNAFYLFSKESWFLFGLNILFFISTIPMYISYARWQKEIPKDE